MMAVCVWVQTHKHPHPPPGSDLNTPILIFNNQVQTLSDLDYPFCATKRVRTGLGVPSSDAFLLLVRQKYT